jgi:glutamate racemase
VFDSGGGLSVLKNLARTAVKHAFTCRPGYVPYGPRRERVQFYGYTILIGKRETSFGMQRRFGCYLHHLREAFPDTSFVGMEPAVKPAVEHTRSGVVGVLATPATFQGELYASVVERFAAGVQLIQHTCPGLVAQIEAGQLDSAITRSILEEAIRPMLERGIDTIVLGCTHYPFAIPLIQEIAGAGVRVIDPAPAVARQVRRLLEQSDALSSSAHEWSTRIHPSNPSQPGGM